VDFRDEIKQYRRGNTDGPFNIAAGIPKNSMTVSLLANVRRQDKLGMKKGKRETERGSWKWKKTGRKRS